MGFFDMFKKQQPLAKRQSPFTHPTQPDQTSTQQPTFTEPTFNTPLEEQIRSKLLSEIQAARRESINNRKSTTRAFQSFGTPSQSSFSDWFQSSHSINLQLESKLPQLRKRSRDLRAGNPYIINYSQFVRDNVVGSGFGFQAQCLLNDGSLDDQNNSKLEAAFSKWGKRCSVDGRMGLVQLLRVAVDTVAVDGEVFVEMVDVAGELKLRLIDANLVPLNMSNQISKTGNRIRMGIEYDADDRVVGYYVKSSYDGEQALIKTRFVPAAKMLHLFVCDFVGQERGIPWNASVQETLRQLSEFSRNELLKAKLAANVQKFVQYSDAALAADVELQEQIPLDALTYDTSPGAIVMLDPGLELAGDSTTQLPTDFRGFIVAQLKQVAAGLRVAYPALASDYSDVNYSSMRSALLVEREFWKGVQNLFVDQLLIPIYEAWLPVAILNRSFVPTGSPLPSKYLDVKFISRGWEWVDPSKDVKANSEAIANGLTSRSAVLAEKGTDFESVLKDIAREKALAAQYGVDLSEITPSSSQTGSATGADAAQMTQSSQDPAT